MTEVHMYRHLVYTYLEKRYPEWVTARQIKDDIKEGARAVGDVEFINVRLPAVVGALHRGVAKGHIIQKEENYVEPRGCLFFFIRPRESSKRTYRLNGQININEILPSEKDSQSDLEGVESAPQPT